MQINANNKLTSVEPTTGQRPVAAQAKAGQASPVELRQTEAVNSAFRATPDVRSEEVDRARRLIASVDYPPETIMRGIANLLAVKGVPGTEE